MVHSSTRDNFSVGDLCAGQGRYYCSVGSTAYDRAFIEAALENCHKAGLSISGSNAEVAPGQWEIQIGIVEGIHAADQFYLLKYILHRTAEQFKVSVDFSAKPLGDSFNGTGCHTNFSLHSMRQELAYPAVFDKVKLPFPLVSLTHLRS